MAVTALHEEERSRPLRFVPTEVPAVANDEQAVKPEPRIPEPPVHPAKPARPITRDVIFPTDEVLAVIKLLVTILGTRMLLAAAGIGAFILAFIAINDPSIARISACGVYDLFIFAPLLWLAAGRN